jgi:hypothetical protein
MVPIVGVMLTTAAANAWDLMLGLAKYKAQRTGRDDSTGVTQSGEERADEWLGQAH